MFGLIHLDSIPGVGTAQGGSIAVARSMPKLAAVLMVVVRESSLICLNNGAFTFLITSQIENNFLFV